MKGMEKLLQWSNNFVNHLWYSCRTCNGDSLALKVCMKFICVVNSNFKWL